MEIKDESKAEAHLNDLENSATYLNNLDEKELLSIAMSSYYILYR